MKNAIRDDEDKRELAGINSGVNYNSFSNSRRFENLRLLQDIDFGQIELSKLRSAERMTKLQAKRAVLQWRLRRALAIVRMRRIAALLENGYQRAALERLRREDWR